eukprot:2110463-Lingulodinium_polyedra.AAC.1
MEELKLCAANWDRRRRPATDEAADKDKVESPCGDLPRSSPQTPAPGAQIARRAGPIVVEVIPPARDWSLLFF